MEVRCHDNDSGEQLEDPKDLKEMEDMELRRNVQFQGTFQIEAKSFLRWKIET